MLYKVIASLGHGLFTFLGLKICGADNIPEKGKLILVANHISNWDPVILAFAVSRPICYMAKASLFKYSFFAKILTLLHAFPVQREGADRLAIRQAFEVLKREQVLGLFPEGKRNQEGSSIKIKNGAALIAAKADSPIIPVACIGTRRLIPVGWFRPVKIVIGKPIYPKDFYTEKVNSAALDGISRKIEVEIENLLKVWQV